VAALEVGDNRNMARKAIPEATQANILLRSRRRCCLCFWLRGEDEVKKGQLAHLDGNNENAAEDNLTFLCLEHHDEYDSTSRLSKGLREQEVRKWRDELYKEIEYRFTTNQHALSLGPLHSEAHPDGGRALFRLEVRNNNSHRTVDDVCMRVVSLVRVDDNDDHERLPFAKPLLAISCSGRLPSNPPQTHRDLAASDSLLFDFVNVHCHRKVGSILCYGECIKDHPFQFQGNERWRLAHDAFVRSGKYRITIEVQGRDVIPIRKKFVFWGDKTGAYCMDANDAAAQSTSPLEFAPTELELLPPNMHPHQLRALVTELCKPTYDGMTADEVYRKIDDDVPGMCGLADVRFLPRNDWEKGTILKPNSWAIVISEQEVTSFPAGIPGFPNAIRRSDFDIAWKTARVS
jgi:hypothetical protein